MARDGNLSEVPLPMQPLPKRSASAESRQQGKKRRTEHLTPPPRKNRYFDPKDRTPPSPLRDLPAVEKPSSDLSAAPYGPLQPKESMETYKDRIVRESLEWADGTKKVVTNSELAKMVTDNVQRLVKALLDKKINDEGLEYEKVDIVRWQSFCEGPHAWYYHLNINVKAKGADDDAGSANLFFAEVTRDQNDTPGYFLSSYCRIGDPDSMDGVLCHGCTNNGSLDMKHPCLSTKFNGGHADIDLYHGCTSNKQCGDLENKEYDEEEEELRKEEEQRIIESLDHLDDPYFEEKLRKRRDKLLAMYPLIQEDEETASKD